MRRRCGSDPTDRTSSPRRSDRARFGSSSAQLTHFFALMLWVAAGLAWIAGLPQLSVAIVIVIVVNGAFSFAQEERATKAAESLRSLVPTKAVVVRDSQRTTISVDGPRPR